MASIFCLLGPSCVGKTTCERWISDPNGAGRQLDIVSVPSYTTRQPRPNEIRGVDYNFVTEKEFLRIAQTGDFADEVIVGGHFYGISESDIANQLAIGSNVVIVLNTEGFLLLKELNLAPTYGIFLMPTSLKDLKERLKKRSKDRLDYSIGQIRNGFVADRIVLSGNSLIELREQVYAQIAMITTNDQCHKKRFEEYSSKLLEEYINLD